MSVALAIYSLGFAVIAGSYWVGRALDQRTAALNRHSIETRNLTDLLGGAVSITAYPVPVKSEERTNASRN